MICRDFYFPYARKLWGEPEELSALQARKRVTAGSFSGLIKRVLGSRGSYFAACGKAGRLLHALPALPVMTIAWSWGEWLGYLTRRHPRTLTVAPETPKSATG